MKNELVNYVSKFISLTEDEAAFLEKSVPVRTYKKNEFLLKEGDIVDKCWFVLKGYIGVTPESLSRIRKRLSVNK